jgi:glycosyltransferase involved in cell wall biosynthesis
MTHAGPLMPPRKDDVEVIRASPLFDAEWYQETYPDVKALGMDPAEHYLWLGARLDRRPSPAFDSVEYLRINPDVAESGYNPLIHYERWGKKEARPGGLAADPDGLPDIHCSTFHARRPYPFMAPAALDAVHASYLRQKMSRGATHSGRVVFTAITGDYGAPRYHEHLMNDCDYCVFVDNDSVSDGQVYDLRSIPYFDEDAVRMARFVKTHPHMMVPDYGIAVWIDGNILIRGDISGLIDDFERSGLPVAAVPHPLRTSVYAEAEDCIRKSKDDAGVVEQQMARYRSAGFDGDSLIESNLLMYRLDHPQLAPFLSAWWAEMERGSRRDQLSLTYAMAQTGVTWFPLTQRPDSVRNHPALALLEHGSNPCPHVPKAAMPRYCDVMHERLALQEDRHVDVVVCVHDALDVVKPCLDSVCANRNAERHRLIVVDDGSNEETRDWLRDFASRHDRVDLIRHEQAMGYTKAANAGLRASEADMAVMLNSDTIVAGRWIEKLLDAAFSNAGVGIVGPLSSAASHQSIPNHIGANHQTAINDLPAGYSVADMNAWCESQAPAALVPRVSLVHGFCMALTRDVIEAVGYFDETHFPFGYGEENDYCLRAVDRGFSLAVATHTYVYHKKSQSYADDKRVALAHAGNMKVRELHGTERFLRAVRSVDSNPHLERMRALAWDLIGGPLGTGNPADAQAVLSPATRSSVFGRKLLAILQADRPAGIGEALMASEAALETASARMGNTGQRPLVSIVMPTHDRADVIGDAIQSVVDQDYDNWQLFVCDDASTDNTESIVAQFNDDRIHFLKLPRSGAAAARNKGLAQAQGDIIAYLDSDNVWHPRYLSRMVLALVERPGHSAAYGNFIDYRVEPSGTSIKSFVRPRFDQEQLLRRNYIDLNTFVHRRELYDSFGGFNEALTRRQDYDLIIKYTWLRDPLQTDEIVALYQRNPALRQITTEAEHDYSCIKIIDDSISRYLTSGLPTAGAQKVKRVTILSWDLCRNHFSKPFALAEALSQSYDVQLVSFRFFDEDIFPPLKDVSPRFETVYLQGSRFPDFFEAMDKAVEAIDGDVIYVVKPRLPSLGTALLANARRGIPIILEINDLETVVASPTAGDRHRETAFDSVDLAERELLNPYSDPWSHIMDPIAKTLPVLATHNKFIDAHFAHRCLYMRNLKDEAVYDPALYDRDAVRAELGLAPGDRVILFGGMVRRHKGVYELIDLVERLGDARYKLLFVGSRETPDQRQLVERFGTRVRVLPPQDRVAMARINLAADLVILWLDPDVPASHAQMPYKATDALAMTTPIIANDISDLGDLGRQGYLRLVPFGDWDAMARTIEKLFSDQAGTAAMREAGRRLYLRQFSYAAARADFALMLHRVQGLDAGPLPAASAFARRFDEFRRAAAAATQPAQQPPLQSLKIDGHGEVPEDASIVALDVTALDRLTHHDPDGVAIVMPSIDTATALATARLLVRRAGLGTTVFVVEDTLRQGFIRTLNATAARLDVKYVVYLAEDAFPGVDWLKLAHDHLEHSGKGLLAFNDGKWKGRIAAFGMVRKAWVATLYGGPVLYPDYRSHRADNELTAIARATDQFIYAPECVLTEIDARKAFRTSEAEAGNFTEDDKRLFILRFDAGFDGLAPQPRLEALRDEYLNQRKLARAKQRPSG